MSYIFKKKSDESIRINKELIICSLIDEQFNEKRCGIEMFFTIMIESHPTIHKTEYLKR